MYCFVFIISVTFSNYATVWFCLYDDSVLKFSVFNVHRASMYDTACIIGNVNNILWFHPLSINYNYNSVY